MIVASSPIYTFADPSGLDHCIMVWQLTDGSFEVRILSGENDGQCIPAGNTALEALAMADVLVQGLALTLVRATAVPISAGGLDDYWEIE